jgi:hypothetical protein
VDQFGARAIAGLLAAAGLWFLIRQCDWPRERRQEIYLSLWLAAGLSAELATAHPTFERYFLVMVPFVAIPAIVGLYAVGVRLAGPDRPLHAAYLLMIVLTLGLGRGCSTTAIRMFGRTPRRSPKESARSPRAARFFGPTS